jgi:hypothetical protein
VKGLDLCKEARLQALADLKVKVLSTKSDTQNHQGADESCFFKLRTASGRDASLSLAVTTFESIEEAWLTLELHRKFREERMNYEGSPSGIGEAAQAFSKETVKDEYQQAEYLILARFQNRLVYVWLSVFDKPLIEKAKLAEKTRVLVQDTAELAAKYRPGP